jgi:hypothetical protein
MPVKSMMRASVALGALTLAMWANNAAAQTQPIPPAHYTLDPRGVDLVSGGFNHVTTEVVIGQPGAGGLAHTRQHIAAEGWRDVEVGGLSYSNGEYIVSTGLLSAVFVPDGAGGWKPKYDDGSTLEWGPAETHWLVTDRNGNRAVIDYLPGLSGYSFTEGPVQSETATDGTVTTYHWKMVCRDGGEPPHCLNDVKQLRLQSITNNRGYQLKFYYQSNTPSPTANWLRTTKVVGLNLAVDYCEPMADSCPTFRENWPSVTYAYTGSEVTSATDQSGRVTSYTYSAGGLATIRYPDATHDDVAVSYNASPDFRVNAVTDASGAWTYDYSISGATQTTSVAGPLME